MRGSKLSPSGTWARIRSRYAKASSTVLTGGTRFGMQIARANCFAKSGTVRFRAKPSRKCACQSSGCKSVRVFKAYFKLKNNTNNNAYSVKMVTTIMDKWLTKAHDKMRFCVIFMRHKNSAL